MELPTAASAASASTCASAEGRELLLRLVETADVFLTNFLPVDARRSLGLGVDDLRAVNPKHHLRARATASACAGPTPTSPPTTPPPSGPGAGSAPRSRPPSLERPINQRGGFGDRNGAVQLAFGIAGALFRRERTGEPSVVDVSLLATAMWTLASDVLSALQGNFAAAPVAGQAARMSPNPLSNTYETKDGRFLSLLLLQPDRHWPDLARAIEPPRPARRPALRRPAPRSSNTPTDMVDILEPLFSVAHPRRVARRVLGRALPVGAVRADPRGHRGPAGGGQRLHRRGGARRRQLPATRPARCSSTSSRPRCAAGPSTASTPSWCCSSSGSTGTTSAS